MTISQGVRKADAVGRVLTAVGKRSRTKQQFKDECDINNILSKYQKSGAVTHVNKHAAEYGFATSEDFTSAMFLVTDAQAMFNELPSSLRTKFKNDPAEFLEFVQDPENADELVELGLAPPPVPAERSSPPADVGTAEPGGAEAAVEPDSGSDTIAS